MKRAEKFYEIIIKKAGSFELLKEALKKTLQTGALAVLEKFERK